MAAVFAYLEDYEISLNERIAEQLKQAGLTLGNPDNRQQCIDYSKRSICRKPGKPGYHSKPA